MVQDIAPLTEFWETPGFICGVNPGVSSPGQFLFLVHVQNAEHQAVFEFFLVLVVNVHADELSILAVLGLQADFKPELLIIVNNYLHKNKTCAINDMIHIPVLAITMLTWFVLWDFEKWGQTDGRHVLK